MYLKYIEQLKKSDKITRERLLFGNFEYDDDESKLFSYDDILDIFNKHTVSSADKYRSVDVARFGSDKTVIMVCFIKC